MPPPWRAVLAVLVLASAPAFPVQPAAPPARRAGAVLRRLPPAWRAAIGRALEAPSFDPAALTRELVRLDAGGSPASEDLETAAPGFSRLSADPALRGEAEARLQAVEAALDRLASEGSALPAEVRSKVRAALTSGLSAVEGAGETTAPVPVDEAREGLRGRGLGRSNSAGTPGAGRDASAAAAAGFRSAPEEYRRVYEEWYRRQSVNDRLFSNGLGASMAARIKNGDSASRGLQNLGFSLSKDGSRLVMPASFADLFAAQAEHAAARSKAPLFLALSFRKIGGAGEDGLLYVAPGRDPWPSPEEYELVPDGQLTDKEFFTALASRRIPVSLDEGGAIFFHDLGHVLEMSDPEVAGQVPGYAARLLESGKAVQEDASDPDKARSFFIWEWLTLPDLGNEGHIRRLLSHWFEDGGTLRELSWGRDYWTEILARDPAHAKARVSELLEASDRMISRHGGAARDHYSLRTRYDDGSIAWEIVADIGEGREPATWKPRGDYMAASTLPSLINEIRVLQALRHDPASRDAHGSLLHGVRNAVEPLLYMDAERVRAHLDARLADRVARLESALYRGVRLGVTAGDFYRGALLDAPAPGSAIPLYLAGYLQAGHPLLAYFAADKGAWSSPEGVRPSGLRRDGAPQPPLSVRMIGSASREQASRVGKVLELATISRRPLEEKGAAVEDFSRSLRNGMNFGGGPAFRKTLAGLGLRGLVLRRALSKGVLDGLDAVHERWRRDAPSYLAQVADEAAAILLRSGDWEALSRFHRTRRLDAQYWEAALLARLRDAGSGGVDFIVEGMPVPRPGRSAWAPGDDGLAILIAQDFARRVLGPPAAEAVFDALASSPSGEELWAAALSDQAGMGREAILGEFRSHLPEPASGPPGP